MTDESAMTKVPKDVAQAGLVIPGPVEIMLRVAGVQPLHSWAVLGRAALP